MEVKSIYKYARISPFKVREVTREIQGLPVSAALDLLAFTPKKAAFLIGKTLKSAIANAENNANLRVDGLVVKEATVGEGPTMKRMMTRARSASQHPDRSLTPLSLKAGTRGVLITLKKPARAADCLTQCPHACKIFLVFPRIRGRFRSAPILV